MEFAILGPLEIIDRGRELTPRRAKQRALLAMLLLHANEVVPTDRLMDALWGETAPETAPKALQGHVSALRKLLGSARIETRPGGYRLRLEPEELDLTRFEALVAAGRRTAEPRERAARLDAALQLWRGEPLADLRYESFAQEEIGRLEELRIGTLEERIEADLECGRHLELLPELERLVARHALRERLREQHMLALYRAGRQADALRVYQDARRLLAEELGIDPGAALQVLERQILSQDPALEPPRPARRSGPRQERKRVTVVIAELMSVGALDPEDLLRSVHPALGQASAVMARFGGTVQPLFANALLALFGAPRAHEDDAERAVRAALAVRETIAPLAGLELRAGVASGEALVTVDDDRVEVTGDVLTGASRLQASAPPDTILVDEPVQRATRAAIEYAETPGGWQATATRRPVRAQDLALPETPFVGRDEQLALLDRAFVRARGEGSVQLVTIAGEPGAGKTRLVVELRALLENRQPPHLWREGRCLPYGDGVTYWALGEIVKAQVGILESDGPHDSAGKLAASVAAIVPEDETRIWLEGSLAPLVGIEAGAATGDRSQSFAAWRQFLERIAWQQPLVLVIEDLHWADEALLEFISHLVERASAPLLVVCTTRLELLDEHPEWGGGKRNTTTLTLAPLSRHDTARLLRVLLGREPLVEEIRLAGGNPLFAYELARMGGSDPDARASVPESIQALIAARLDTLPPELKDLASNAAVVGEVFWSGALASIGGIDERAVDEGLQRLVATEVIRRSRSSSVRAESEYSFLHVLVRDVAYHQIPRGERAHKHQVAAKWIEGLAGGRVIDHAEFLAHHYGAALELARAAGRPEEISGLEDDSRRFLIMAGDRAMRLDVGAAERFYRRALELLVAGDPERARVIARLADAAQEAGRLREAEARYEEAIAQLTASGEELDAARAMTKLSSALWRLGDTGRHRAVLDQAVALLERRPLGPDLVRAWGLKARSLVLAGNSMEALPWIERAMAGAGQVGAPDVRVRMLMYRDLAGMDLGETGGLENLREAIRLGLELGLGFETAVCYSNMGELVAREAGPADGLRVAHQAIEFAEQRGLVHIAVRTRANITLPLLFELGRWDEALAGADEALRRDRADGVTQISAWAFTAKAEVLLNRGAVVEAAAVIGHLLPLARQIGDLQTLVPALTLAARLERTRPNLGHAVALVEEIEEATRGNPGWRSHTVADCVRVCVAASALPLADALLEGTDTRVRRRRGCVLSARATLAEARGEIESAAALHAAAADLWNDFGYALEHGHGLLGKGRCLVRRGTRQDAIEPLQAARAIFDGLGAQPLVAEADLWLAEADQQASHSGPMRAQDRPHDRAARK